MRSLLLLASPLCVRAVVLAVIGPPLVSRAALVVARPANSVCGLRLKRFHTVRTLNISHYFIAPLAPGSGFPWLLNRASGSALLFIAFLIASTIEFNSKHLINREATVFGIGRPPVLLQKFIVIHCSEQPPAPQKVETPLRSLSNTASQTTALVYF
jgi:hypothetical protein